MKDTTIHIVIESEMKQEVAKLAWENRLSMSELCRIAIKEKIEGSKHEKI